MMLIEGKTFYRIDDAVKEYGYTKGMLINYISSGTIEAERMEDGEWLITETGWVQLRRRKKGAIHGSTPPTPAPVQSTPEVKPDHIVDVTKKDRVPDTGKSSPKPVPSDPVIKQPNKTKHHPDGFKEGALYVRTPEDHEDYDVVIDAAKLLKMTVGDLNMVAVRYYVRDILKKKITELKEIESKKKDIIAGLSN